MNRRNLLLALSALPVAGAATSALAATAPSLQSLVDGSQRTAVNRVRDAFRHPRESLEFWGLKPGMTVVEVSPSGGYWTEILAPYLRDKGHYIAALSPDVPDDEEGSTKKKWLASVEARAAFFGPVKVVRFGKGALDLGAPGSADLIVTFRNLHNWVGDGYADEALAACFRALKPGGILGIEDHRGRTDVAQDPKAANGYIREDYTIALVEKAGFKLVGKSEINANPRDTKDWVDGVWTLPPTLSQGDRDREKYVAIGEADNFVLKFEKPRR